MCTVTIVPTGARDAGAFRMACSRDELHGRAPAQPPQTRTIDNQRVLMPIDPASNGTWVGVNQSGLALTLLNYNPTDPPIGRDRSRGTVIPLLLNARTVGDVVALASEVERERMMPFRLVACDGETLLLWRSTESIEQAEAGPWSRSPVMFTSSGLGDHMVEGPRRELFDTWFAVDATTYTDRQLAYHQHRWLGREHLSVAMHRDDARTVSYTTVTVDADRIAMIYHPDRPDRDAQDVTATLQRRLARQ